MRKLLAVTGLIAFGAAVSTGVVFGAGAVLLGHQWWGGGSGSGCGTAFHTTQTDFDVDDDGDFDSLTPASYVDFTKKCHGAAVATWSSEVVQGISEDIAAQSHDDLEVVLRATCTHPLPLIPSSCQFGEVAYGEPGGEDDPVQLDEDIDSDKVAVSFQWVFPSLKPGSWRIDVLAGEGEDLVLGYRTLFVETL